MTHNDPDYDRDTGVLCLHSPRCRKCGERYRKGSPCACETGSMSDAWERYKIEHGIKECE